jgi:hypothetical protein
MPSRSSVATRGHTLARPEPRPTGVYTGILHTGKLFVTIYYTGQYYYTGLL